MTKDYIGVKKVTAWREDRDGVAGYVVKYEDGYVSWSPADVFERFYFPLENGHENKVSIEDVERFTGEVKCGMYDKKTTVGVADLLNGFRQIETSSCVDPRNYDHQIGSEVVKNRIRDTVWMLLGFVMQWSTYGLKPNHFRSADFSDVHIARGDINKLSGFFVEDVKEEK